MPWTVSFDESNGIINACVSGTTTIKDHYGVLDEVLELCHKNGCLRLLIDLREWAYSRLGTIACFNFGRSVARMSPDLRIAHVMPKDAQSRDDVYFACTVEANRGVRAREFETLEEATQWLLDGP